MILRMIFAVDRSGPYRSILYRDLRMFYRRSRTERPNNAVQHPTTTTSSINHIPKDISPETVLDLFTKIELIQWESQR